MVLPLKDPVWFICITWGFVRSWACWFFLWKEHIAYFRLRASLLNGKTGARTDQVALERICLPVKGACRESCFPGCSLAGATLGADLPSKLCMASLVHLYLHQPLRLNEPFCLTKL